jgi:ribonuclease III
MDGAHVSIEGLQERCGHTFADPERLLLALTHRSWAHENGGGDNERLEFLGDAILQASSTLMLMERFAEAREGELSRLRSRVVSTKALAEVGRQLELGPSLRLGVGEEQTGGRTRDRVLACATEAVLGAIYEDAGMEACHEAVRRWLGPRMDGLEAQSDGGWKDPRSRLQELTQRHGGSTPQYAVQQQEGPAHELVFVVQVTLDDVVLGTGTGPSKRAASRQAAEQALLGLGR